MPPRSVGPDGDCMRERGHPWLLGAKRILSLSLCVCVCVCVCVCACVWLLLRNAKP